MSKKELRRGDPCPCCGQPIKTNNPDVLRLLSWISEQHRIPSVDESRQILNGDDPEVTRVQKV